MRLKGTSGGYDQTIAIAGNFQANPAPDDTVDVHFENVPTAANYSLTYIASGGQESMLVENAPFHTLKDDLLPPEPSGTPAPTPEPQS